MNRSSHSKINIFFIVLFILCLFSTGYGDTELPELFPKQAFFDTGGAKGDAHISPNGQYLSYKAASTNRIPNVWVKTLGKEDDHVITQEHERPFYGYHWAYDNEHILYLKDSDGDENFHLYSANIKTKETKDLTPFDGAKAQNLLMNPKYPEEVLLALNVRDKRLFDMYRINLKTGKAELNTENPGDVRWWLADEDFVIRAAVAIGQEDSSMTIRVRDAADKPWRILMHWPFGETGLLEGYGSEIAIAFTPDGKSLYVQAAFEGDMTQIARVCVEKGKVLEIIAKDPEACIWNDMDITLYDKAVILFHPETKAVQAVGFYHQKPKYEVYDPELKDDFEILENLHEGIFFIDNRDLQNNLWIVKCFSDHTTGETYLYDRSQKKAILLWETAPLLKKYTFSPMKPIIIKARDKLDIPCYLTLPVGIEGKNLPLVMAIHGGPWARDKWGFNGLVQWMANRGYAVLQVNYRGSAGFGKKHLNAGIGEWGVGYMQHDITDAAQWAIDQGIADPKRIGIFGGSYGGYATLAGAAFTPDLYACAIAMSGLSNVKTFLDTMPDWWEVIRMRWILRIGKKILEGEDFNRRISPLFHADKITTNLMILHGENDPRVKISESDQIVATMRENGQKVVYVVYPDEGHGLGNPMNLFDALCRIEDFFAENLGGRSEPCPDIPGSSAELR